MVEARLSRHLDALRAACARPSSIAAFILLSSACVSLDPPVLIQEDFEACEAACGWVSAGPGKATLVTTYHPGEHGLRLEGEITLTRVFDPPLEGASLAWVADGALGVSIVVVDGGVETPMNLADAIDHDPEIDETTGGFRPHLVGLGAGTPSVRAVSLQHAALAPPITIDAFRVLGINTEPGCY